MKALIFKGVGDNPIQLEDVKTPDTKDGYSIVRVKAAALNRRDFWITQGKYPGLREDVILGADGAGLSSGERAVIINPNRHWGDSERVQSKKYHIMGMPQDGTFAEYVVVKNNRLHDMPKHLDWAQGAALPVAGITAYRALFVRGKIEAGHKVLITGVGGGVALMAAQFAMAAGAEVCVTSGNDEKISKAKALGIVNGANYKQENWANELKEKAGYFDLIIDSAGGAGFKSLVDLAAPGATIVFYGGSLGTIPLNPQKVFWKQLNILGSTMGSDADFKNMLSFVSKHKIKPVVENIFPLSEYKQAFELLEQGSQFGKIVLTP